MRFPLWRALIDLCSAIEVQNMLSIRKMTRLFQVITANNIHKFKLKLYCAEKCLLNFISDQEFWWK